MPMPLLFALALILIAFLAYVGRYSGRLRVERSREIAAPLAEVYAAVADFATWPGWCPWLEHDPDIVPQLAGQGCSWRTARAGDYEIVHQVLEPGRRIRQRIVSRDPFRYAGQMHWEFAERDGRTLVTWRIKGRVAFVLRAFAATVRGALELDLRYGLDKLAGRLEGGGQGEAYRIEYLGLRDVPASRQVSESWQGPIAGLRTAVDAALGRLRQRLAAAGIVPAGDPLAAFLRTNVKLGTTACRIGIPVADETTTLETTATPAHRAWVVRLSGNRAALDIAWYEAMQRLRIDDCQPDPAIPPVERYVAEAVTELLLPVRGT